MVRSEKRRLRKLFEKDPTHGEILPADCRRVPSGVDTYDKNQRRLFKMSDVSELWTGDRTVRLAHGPAGVVADGEGDDKAEALIAAGTLLEARLVFVRLEREVGFVLPTA